MVVDHSDCAVIVYLDDIVVFGINPRQVWAYEMMILCRSCEARFLMNVRKCKLLVSTIKVLGQVIADDAQKPIFI